MNMNEKTVNIKTLSAASSGTISLGGELTVHRLGFGAMRITGDGIWGPPKNPAAATYSSSTTLHQGPQQLTLMNYGPAHTDGDTVVYVSPANVAVVGDIFS